MTRTSRRTRLATAAVLAPLALGLAACGGDDDTADDTPTATVTVTESPTSDASAEPTSTDDGQTEQSPTENSGSGNAGDIETAASSALAAIDGTIYSIDLDNQGWDVTVVTADGTENDVDLALDATTITRGPVVDPDNDQDDAAERERLQGVALDYAAAIEAARGQVQGTVTGVDLSEDGGQAVWEVQFDEDTATETTVDVDAETGDVLRTEQDD